LEQWAHDARAVMDAVGSQRTAVFALAPTALEAVVFATTYPDRVAALVVVNGMARMLWAPDFPLGVSREFMETFRRV
ncbi:alpha/beta fold hydrolase, partial [Jeotgalibacillus marinus]